MEPGQQEWNGTRTDGSLTLSKLNVLVTAKLHPASNALLIMAELVVGVAEARPNGFSKWRPAVSTLMFTRSTGV